MQKKKKNLCGPKRGEARRGRGKTVHVRGTEMPGGGYWGICARSWEKTKHKKGGGWGVK